MKVHEFTPGEDIADIKARLELAEDALMVIGAAGAIHFDDASEWDAYDDRVLAEAKAIKRKRDPEKYRKLADRNRRIAESQKGKERPSMRGPRREKIEGQGPKRRL